MENTNSTSHSPVCVTYNALTYAHDLMPGQVEDFINAGKVKTGYANIDGITNLYPGLYVIGAISSLGKTTFVHQMCDQLAASGQSVIYFSLEQSALELVSKSLSRIMGKNNQLNALTSLQIRKMHQTDERIEEAKEQYYKFAANETIVECSFMMTIEDIEHIVDDFISVRKIKPIVVIDYLQVIQSISAGVTSKDSVDTSVKRLKQLQENHNIVIIVISSLNRQNYLSSIDYESFKESGGIEYTADVLWGLQLEAIHDPIFDSQAKINEKREIIRKAKAAIPRRIELVCLKNRFGISSYNAMFNYYPQFDLFVPDIQDLDQILNSDEVDCDGFAKLPDVYSGPFNK